MMAEEKYTVCENCHRTVRVGDVDRDGLCVFCTPSEPKVESVEDVWNDLGRPEDSK